MDKSLKRVQTLREALSGNPADFDIEDIDDSLYRAALGTRPELPSDLGIEEEEEYKPVLCVFYASTATSVPERATVFGAARSPRSVI